MKKEQFKNSISKMISHHINQVIQFSNSMREAQESNDTILMEVIAAQSQGSAQVFEQGLNMLIDQMIPDETEESEEVVEDNEC
jgi:hypothetical protein